jgi:thymidine kinase
MQHSELSAETLNFMKSLGFPRLKVHHSYNHFDFTEGGRRILVIGPMGSGKTEFSARVWRDARIARQKSGAVAEQTSSGSADRRIVYFVRSVMDKLRFPDYPADALAYRGGYERCGENICYISNSFELEQAIHDHPEAGTWIVDEASFYDERTAYVVKEASLRNDLVFIFPTLVLNFRRDIFNRTTQFLLENCTDIFPLTAYCEHPDCIEDSFYTYRYYRIDDEECPALYFDPLIVIGGDTTREDPRQPNYCTRCDRHHYLPGKEYTYLVLKPLGESASRGDLAPLRRELELIESDIRQSRLHSHLESRFLQGESPEPVNLNALKVPCIAEKALIFLFAEQNLISEDQMRLLVGELDLDREYMQQTLRDNGRPLDLDQFTLSFK